MANYIIVIRRVGDDIVEFRVDAVSLEDAKEKALERALKHEFLTTKDQLEIEDWRRIC